MAYRDLEEAIDVHNAVPQGLASSIFTNDLREAELFLSSSGCDWGSPMSILGGRERRSAACSVAKRRPAAGASWE